jgi:predicted transcriptional regulator
MSRPKRRSREELIEHILKEAKEPEAKVIAVSRGLDWNTWLALSTMLVSRGMLTTRNGYYQTTGKGVEWLEARERMKAVGAGVGV